MTDFSEKVDIKLIVFLVTAVFGTSIGLIASSHDCRNMYSILQDLELEGWVLQEDHSRLLLEHSTWASYDRIEKVAKHKLFMKPPDLTSLVLIPK